MILIVVVPASHQHLSHPLVVVCVLVDSFDITADVCTVVHAAARMLACILTLVLLYALDNLPHALVRVVVLLCCLALTADGFFNGPCFFRDMLQSEWIV